MPQIKAKPNLDTLKVSFHRFSLRRRLLLLLSCTYGDTHSVACVCLTRENEIFIANNKQLNIPFLSISFFFFFFIPEFGDCRPTRCTKVSNVILVMVQMAPVRWPNGHWLIWSMDDKMASEQSRVHSQRRNGVKSTTIIYQITKVIWFRWRRKSSAEHFHVMETISSPPVKVSQLCVTFW